MPLVNDQTLKFPSCLNHLKHGATATTLFLDDENPDYFFELVTRTVHDQWILLRPERACDTFEADLHLHEMELLDRCPTTAARAYSLSSPPSVRSLGPQLFASKMQSRRAAILGSEAAF